MAPSIDAHSLRAAWRALDGSFEGEGLRTILVSETESCTISAGRRLPGNNEALVVEFKELRRVSNRPFPQGYGFEVFQPSPASAHDEHFRLALARREGGSVDLFAMMAEDLMAVLNRDYSHAGEYLFELFLSRISAWQDFMDHRNDGVLSPEAEVGLFGELVVLDAMIEAGVPAKAALEIWQGPDDGLQDFMLASGGIEVKTTIAAGEFHARITSLEQLDDSLRQPLFLAAVRLALDPGGQTLPQFVDALRIRFEENRPVADLLDLRVLQAGLLPMSSDRYKRRFRHLSTAVLAVRDNFPRLTKATVHPCIRKARYDVELDLDALGRVSLEHALEALGAI